MRSATRRAARCCISSRAASVFIPRSNNQESWGPRMAPKEFWITFNLLPSSSVRVTAKPAIKSLWPPRNLVPLCSTMSKPKAIGCCR